MRTVEDWLALLDDDLSQLDTIFSDTFRITTLQKQDSIYITLLSWIASGDCPPWIGVKGLSPELRLLWHHRNNLSVDNNGVIWRKMSSQSHMQQLLVPKPAREQLFLSYHASLFGGHFGRNRTLAQLAHRFYWLGQCTACIKRKSPAGRHRPLGNIPTGHRCDRLAMDILDLCDATPAGYRYILVILVIADYISKWTEAFPIKNKCADTVADMLVENIILRFGMPLVIHSDQCWEFENGLMKSLCTLLGCRQGRSLTGLSQTAWLNDLIEYVSWCCPCSSTTGLIIGMSYYRVSCTPTELVSTSPPGTPHSASWWEKGAHYHRMFLLLNLRLNGNIINCHTHSDLGPRCFGGRIHSRSRIIA